MNTKNTQKGLCMICRKDNVELSDEHIIPDSLGGVMHTYRVCKTCNSDLLGRKIDPLLTNHILIELVRFAKRIEGKKGGIPNPLGGTMNGDDELKYLVCDNDGKLDPHLVPDVDVNINSGEVKLVLDARDKIKAQGILDKICERNGWRKHQLTEKELETKTAPAPKFSIPMAIDLQDFKMPMLKIAYEFCVESIEGYFDDPLAVKISSILFNVDFDELKKLVIVGNGFENPIGKIFDQFIDNNGNRHTIIVMNIDNSLFCSVSVFNTLFLMYKMSDSAYTSVGNGIIAINDVSQHTAQTMSLDDLINHCTSYVTTEVILDDMKKYNITCFATSADDTIVFNAIGCMIGNLSNLLCTIPQESINDTYENKNDFVTEYVIHDPWYLMRLSDCRMVKMSKVRCISNISKF